MAVKYTISNTLYKQLDSICAELGITPSIALNMFIRATVRENKIPFDIKQSIRDEVIRSRKAQCANMYAKQIKIILDKTPEAEREHLRNKILDEIYNIRCYSHISAGEYFELGLYRFSKDYWLDNYLSDIDTRAIIQRFNTPVKGIDMGDKYECYTQLKQFYHRDACPLRKKDDKYDFVGFVRDHGRVLIKPVYGSLGNGVELVEYDKIKDWDAFVDNIFRKNKAGVLAEEIVTQDDDMAVFNKSSVNTIRVTTLRMDDRIYSHIYMRVGVNNMIVDNVAQGGLICELDQNTGEVLRARDVNGQFFTTHPTTGVPIVGQFVPDIEGVIKQAEEVAMTIPHYRYIGFDFCKVNNKWIIIEVNNKTGIVSVQSALDRGLKQDLSKAFAVLGEDSSYEMLTTYHGERKCDNIC